MCKLKPHRLQPQRLQLRSTSGQTLAEYALIIAIISVVAIGALLSMGGQVSNVYTTVNRQLQAASVGGTTSTRH